MTARPLRDGERTVVAAILRAVGWSVSLDGLRVTEMDDGQMGSLRFVPATEQARLGATLGEARFEDADGIAVSAVLTVNQVGDLFELDVWKVDFSPLRQWPEADGLDARATAS